MSLALLGLSALIIVLVEYSLGNSVNALIVRFNNLQCSNIIWNFIAQKLQNIYSNIFQDFRRFVRNCGGSTGTVASFRWWYRVFGKCATSQLSTCWHYSTRYYVALTMPVAVFVHRKKCNLHNDCRCEYCLRMCKPEEESSITESNHTIDPAS